MTTTPNVRVRGIRRALLAAFCVLACLPVVARAQAAFSQSFDNLGNNDANNLGPTALMAQGWIFRNQSSPQGFAAWGVTGPDTNPIFPTAHSGGFYLGIFDHASGGVYDPLNAWAILPPIANQNANDKVVLYVHSFLSTSRLEVRYSPTGAIGTGSGPGDIGAFTTLLGSVTASNSGWLRLEYNLPGAGRIALRYTGTRAAWNGFHDFVLIDTLSVGPPPPSPCNQPPTPSAGQTVHWTLANSPYRVCQSITIPAGATVVVDPGVQVTVESSRQITVQGEMRVMGTAAQPNVLTALANYPPMIVVDGGRVEAHRTTFGGQVRPSAGAETEIFDSTFNGPNGLVFTDLYMGNAYARFERVTFNGSDFILCNHTMVLRDITLNDTDAMWLRDYVFANNITSDGRPIGLEGAPQGTLIDRVTVRNAPHGLGLMYGNFFIGPDVTLTNNGFTAHADNAGILPGSTLPPTGNQQNLVFIPGGDHGNESIWADAGIPYYVSAFYLQHGGSLKILDGVTVKMAGQAGMIKDPSPITVYGTEERPVRFEQGVPGQRWYPLQGFHRIRHGILDGAITAAAWPSQVGPGFMDSSIVRNSSEYGVRGGAIVRKTLFQNNAVGAFVSFNDIDLLGITNPNAFENNALAVLDAGNATYNWWNSPTGPRHASNPGGTGDPVADGVPFIPFRTERPDFNDAPPIVDFEKPFFFAKPGERVILNWKARDDGSITSQRIYMTLDGDVFAPDVPSGQVVMLADDLPGDQRSFEFAVPEPPVRFFGYMNIRVESFDNAGQIGWDDIVMSAEREEQGSLTLTSPNVATVTAGELMGDVCWTENDINPIGGDVNAFILLENTGDALSLGGVTTYLTCLPLDLTAPYVSTDRARIVLSLFTHGGIRQPEYFFSEPFSIRPDPRVGDAAPTVTMTSPAPGSAHGGNQPVVISWQGSDDEFVRHYHIQVSTDGGRTWGFIASNIPGTQTSYTWLTPPWTGASQLLLKVVAVDRRFQDTSSIVAITLDGSLIGASCDSIDFNGDGLFPDNQDLVDYLAVFGGGDCSTGTCGDLDFNNDGLFPDNLDLETFFRVFGGGAC
ncbi:MAG TPA: choice-of-anchor J domain-containing protein [Phycisphaerales bacterium]|nr:choice-of-anchor J domain-containing protein [Phycisphaerales bacterium]